MRHRQSQFSIAYLNFAFIWGKSLLAILIIMFCFITVKTVSPVKPNAIVEIIMTWDDNSVDDVDLWVNPPDNHPIFYANREGEGGLISLDRDDIGINDHSIVNGITINSPQRDEVVSIRGMVTGHYTVVANLFFDRDMNQGVLSVGAPIPKPIHVKIQIVQLDPTNGIIYTNTRTLTINNQELYMVSFDLNSDKSITNIDDSHPVSIMGLSADSGAFVSDEFQQ